MKRVFSVLLLMALVFGLMACGDGSAQKKEVPAATGAEEILTAVDTFSVGFCKLKMNPQTSAALVGYSNTKFRWANNILDDIYTCAMAMADGNGNCVIVINADIISVAETLTNEVRVAISQKTHVPEEHIMLSGTHSHSLPDISSTDIPESVTYRALVVERIVESAVKAVEDLKPATMFTGSIETQNMNFIRHYEMSDGSVVSDNYGTTVGKTYLGHTAQADPTLHVVRFEREGAKDIIIGNWRAHPHFTGGVEKYDMSSDYIGPFREAVEDQTGAHFLFLQGAAGNVNEKSRIATENRTTDHRVYGAILADYTLECLEGNMKQVSTDRIGVSVNTIYCDINKASDHLYYYAKEVNTVFQATGDQTAAMEYGESYGIHSVYHASATVANHSRTKEVDGKMLLTAVSVGDDFAFVTFPGEAYDTISVRTEEGSPYGMTMFIGYCNHHIGYIPNDQAFSYGCYETDITRFVQGTDSVVVDQYIAMLEELKNG